MATQTGRTKSSSRSTSSRKTNSKPQAARSNESGGVISKAALSGIAGAVALGFAGRTAIKRARKPRVLGVPVPRELTSVDIDVKKLAKQVGKVAERVERASEEVREASAQAKRMSQKLS